MVTRTFPNGQSNLEGNGFDCKAEQISNHLKSVSKKNIRRIIPLFIFCWTDYRSVLRGKCSYKVILQFLKGKWQ